MHLDKLLFVVFGVGLLFNRLALDFVLLLEPFDLLLQGFLLLQLFDVLAFPVEWLHTILQIDAFKQCAHLLQLLIEVQNLRVVVVDGLPRVFNFLGSNSDKVVGVHRV